MESVLRDIFSNISINELDDLFFYLNKLKEAKKEEANFHEGVKRGQIVLSECSFDNTASDYVSNNIDIGSEIANFLYKLSNKENDN